MLNHQLKQQIVSRVGSKISLSILGKLTRTNLILPYYHMVSDEDVLHVKHLYHYKTTRQFKEDMDILLKNYYPVGLTELLTSMTTGQPLPGNAFLLTFDDGFREMHDIVAPILLEKGVHATFFINSAFIDNRQMCYLNKASILVDQFKNKHILGMEEKAAQILDANGSEFDDVISAILSVGYHNRHLLEEIAKEIEIDFDAYLSVRKPYLTSNQINQLIKDGFTIGAHSIDHPYFANLSLAAQLEQAIGSVKQIRENFRLDYGAFAFPHNDDGVSREFFKKIHESGLIDITFGTGGLANGGGQTHRQRFSLEKPVLPARELLTWQYARRLYNQLKWK
jgi:peptidoglycan/xylan/chitin deacetylase (PgdA/CDA1 family)